MRLFKTWFPIAALLLLTAYLVAASLANRISHAAAQDKPSSERQMIANLAKEDHLGPLFKEISRSVKPAVVEIRVTKRAKPSPEVEEFLRRFTQENGTNTPPRQYYSRGLGSGVIVDARNGYIVTNYHVVAGASQTQVELFDGRQLTTEWIRTDPQSDLAVVKVEAKDLADVPLGNSDTAAVGDWVLAFGSPEGLQQTVTAGIISATGRSTTQLSTYQDFIQTDAAINQGNSGGPLVNMRGEVIGLNAAIISPSGASAGIGFAIPSNMIKSVLAQLVDKGKVTRGYLGVGIQSATPKLAQSLAVPHTHGALLTSVQGGSPADKAGLREGDFVTKVKGQGVESSNQLRNLIASITPGSTVSVAFYRDGKPQKADVTLQAQPAALAASVQPDVGDAETAADLPASTNRYGLNVRAIDQNITRQLGYKIVPKGVMISDVQPGSSADGEGLVAGMIVTSVQSKSVSTPDDFDRAVKSRGPREGLLLRVVEPSGGARYVVLSPAR